MDVKEIVIATKNRGKAREFAEMLRFPGWTVKSLADFPAMPEWTESGQTFLENAWIKASGTANFCRMPALADDSGLCVDALDGAPGVYSARYAGDGARDEDNNRKLIEALRDRGIHTLPPEHPGRSARFVCALVYFDPATGRKIQAEGECPGLILDHPRGQGGFGYDPLFYLPEFGKTMAELTPEEKNRVSHRGKALRSLIEKITSL